MNELIAFIGVLLAAGYTVASGYINFKVAGAVGILAVGTNMLAPFWIHTARQKSLRTTVFVLWIASLFYSFTAAMAFIAQTRQGDSAKQTALYENYQTELQTLKELEAKPKTKTTERQVLDQRERVMTMRTNGAIISPEPHIMLFARFTGIEPETVRLVLLFVLAGLIEAGAAITLYASVGHFVFKPVIIVEAPPDPLPAPQQVFQPLAQPRTTEGGDAEY